MTREEQIIETAKFIYSPSSGIPQSLPMRVGFIEGAKWADSNPNENKNLVSIDTVCKWLSENIEEFITGRDWDVDGESLTNCLKCDLTINKYI